MFNPERSRVVQIHQIMMYRSYLYTWIYYYSHQYLSINVEIDKLKIPSKFDFRLRFSDFNQKKL
jgi:hypothetical protein